MTRTYHCSMCELDELLKRFGPDGWDGPVLRRIFEAGRRGTRPNVYDGRTVEGRAFKAGRRAAEIEAAQLRGQNA